MVGSCSMIVVAQCRLMVYCLRDESREGEQWPCQDLPPTNTCVEGHGIAERLHETLAVPSLVASLSCKKHHSSINGASGSADGSWWVGCLPTCLVCVAVSMSGSCALA